MAMGLLGALLPDMSCSVRMCGDWRVGGAEVEPFIFVGDVVGNIPATARTAYNKRREK